MRLSALSLVLTALCLALLSILANSAMVADWQLFSGIGCNPANSTVLASGTSTALPIFNSTVAGPFVYTYGSTCTPTTAAPGVVALQIGCYNLTDGTRGVVSTWQDTQCSSGQNISAGRSGQCSTGGDLVGRSSIVTCRQVADVSSSSGGNGASVGVSVQLGVWMMLVVVFMASML